MPMPLVLHVCCQNCGLWAITENGMEPNTTQVLRCGCCTLDHNHDQVKEETGTACRPVHLTLISPIQLHVGEGEPQATDLSGRMV